MCDSTRKSNPKPLRSLQRPSRKVKGLPNKPGVHAPYRRQSPIVEAQGIRRRRSVHGSVGLDGPRLRPSTTTSMRFRLQSFSSANGLRTPRARAGIHSEAARNPFPRSFNNVMDQDGGENGHACGPRSWLGWAMTRQSLSDSPSRLRPNPVGDDLKDGGWGPKIRASATMLKRFEVGDGAQCQNSL